MSMNTILYFSCHFDMLWVFILGFMCIYIYNYRLNFSFYLFYIYHAVYIKPILKCRQHADDLATRLLLLFAVFTNIVCIFSLTMKCWIKRYKNPIFQKLIDRYKQIIKTAVGLTTGHCKLNKLFKLMGLIDETMHMQILSICKIRGRTHPI